MARLPNAPCAFVGLLAAMSLLVAQALPLGTSTTSAAQVPASLPFTISLERTVDGFTLPQGAVAFPDGSGRVLVLERAGLLRVVADGVVQETPFLDLTGTVDASTTEQGLLSLAFHPRYAVNGYFFVHYTPPVLRDEENRITSASSTVVRYQVSADSNVANPHSATVVLHKEQPFWLHFGGQIAFGPDGYLWIAFGNGQRPRATRARGPDQSQDLSLLNGKILRIDVDGGEPYAIPADNPFVGVEGARPEVWAYGLRNPWRFSFDRLTGDLYVADVGESEREEVSFVAAGSPGGLNFGWPTLEGDVCFGGSECTDEGFTGPIVAYEHGGSSRLCCAVVGGYVYRGSAQPAMFGAYIYGDFASGKIWALTRPEPETWRPTLVAETGLLISSFMEDEAGEIYLTDFDGGALYRLLAEPA